MNQLKHIYENAYFLKALKKLFFNEEFWKLLQNRTLHNRNTKNI